MIEGDVDLRGKLKVVLGDEGLENYGEQIAIRNWADIYPDVDILVLNSREEVKALISCKTSLRERLTETAFWKRELKRIGKGYTKLVLVTPDKDEELRTETNR